MRSSDVPDGPADDDVDSVNPVDWCDDKRAVSYLTGINLFSLRWIVDLIARLSSAALASG